jgi:hypothetical protein
MPCVVLSATSVRPISANERQFDVLVAAYNKDMMMIRSTTTATPCGFYLLKIEFVEFVRDAGVESGNRWCKITCAGRV